MTPFCLDFVSILIYLHNNYTKIFVKNQTTDTINLPAVGFYTVIKTRTKPINRIYPFFKNQWSEYSLTFYEMS